MTTMTTETARSNEPTYSSDLVKLYINGEWQDASLGGTFESRNPATGELLAVLAEAGPADVDRAVAAARKAFAGWRLLPAPKRGEILFHAGQLLIERKEQLARLMTMEM